MKRKSDRMSCLLEAIYQPPSNGDIAPEEVNKHIKEKLNPFMHFLKSLPEQMLIKGKKTVTDHNGDRVIVSGTLLDFALVGPGEYTCPNGHRWKAQFYKDLKHGICKFHSNALISAVLLEITYQPDGTTQVAHMLNGKYHGFISFHNRNNYHVTN